MALRFSRLILNNQQALGLKAAEATTGSGVSQFTKKVLRVQSFREFFTEKAFFGHANTGPFWLFVLAVPCIYKALASAYWTSQFKKLDRKEILSDRFAWLYEQYLDDEIDTLLIQQARQ